MTKKRVLIGKLGLDGHDVGAKVVVRALMEQGFEVIYTGLRRSPEEIARAALQEDVDAVGVSILSGAHLPLLEKLAEELGKAELTDRAWLVGGVIPKEDREAVRELGFTGIFPTGAAFEEIADFIRENAR
ncbi:MAG: cobalamin B12-binding domain-containing protein [Planctomycetota bacterium]|jgi:methylmalonyl-CoA mutase C-terminal domain/subunit